MFDTIMIGESMKKKNGFTLIELIATIALLAVIAVIAFVSISRVMKKAQEKNCNTLVDNIITATSEYVSDNRYNQEFINNYNVDNNTRYKRIAVNLLVDKHYLNNELVNPYTKEVIDASNVFVTIYLNKDYTMHAAILEDNELQNCNLKYAANASTPEDISPVIVQGDDKGPTIAYSLADEKYNVEQVLDVSATDESGIDYISVEVLKDDVKDSNKSVEKYQSDHYRINLDEGMWKIKTVAYDNAGNMSELSKTYIIDLTIATPTIINRSNEAWTNQKFKLTVSTTTSGIDNWQYTYNKDATAVCTGSRCNAANKWYKYNNSNMSTFITTDFSVDRNQPVYIRACNTKKCSDVASTYIRIDTTPPIIEFSWPQGTYNNKLGYTRLTVSDSGSGVDYWHFHLYKNDTFIENQSRTSVTDTDTTVFELNGYATWTAYGMVYDKAGNRQKDANANGWAYRVYILTANTGGGGGGGGSSYTCYTSVTECNNAGATTCQSNQHKAVICQLVSTGCYTLTCGNCLAGYHSSGGACVKNN